MACSQLLHVRRIGRSRLFLSEFNNPKMLWYAGPFVLPADYPIVPAFGMALSLEGGLLLQAALVPHSGQNFAAGATFAPQFVQCFSRGTAVPHSGQNFAPALSS